MLVLGRKSGEKICVGNDVVITICRVCGGRVQVGVDAPAGMPVYRREVIDRAKDKQACTRLGS